MAWLFVHTCGAVWTIEEPVYGKCTVCELFLNKAYCCSAHLLFIDGSPISSVLSGGDETEEGEEEEGCCEENPGPPSPTSTLDQSQSTTQDQDVAGEDNGKLEEELSNDVPLTSEDEPVEDEESNDQSVDLLMADWQEDLEAFKQMEKDEL